MKGNQMSKSLKKKQGQVVVSKSGDKTIKVKIVKKKTHPFYKKIIKVTWSFFIGSRSKKIKQKLVISIFCFMSTYKR